MTTDLNWKEFLLSDEHVATLKAIVGATHDRIVSDHVNGGFLSEAHSWETRVEEYRAIAPDRVDEALVVRPYGAQNRDWGAAQIIGENVTIKSCHILRCLLWFTPMRNMSEDEILAEREADPAIAHVYRGPMRAAEEIVTHPSRAEEVESGFVNLVDAGVILTTKDRQIACLSRYNGYPTDCGLIKSPEVEELSESYRFIPLEQYTETKP